VDFEDIVSLTGKVVDGAGVAVMVIGIVVSTLRYGRRLSGGREAEDPYPAFRRELGRSVLLGLELLVAGDIIRSVAISPSFESVGVLAVIVVVRSFLSTTLEMEISGRWPWQRPARRDPLAPGEGGDPTGGPAGGQPTGGSDGAAQNRAEGGVAERATGYDGGPKPVRP
jgi:uncharacterized membrane protein